jgi:hypothetical protein
MLAALLEQHRQKQIHPRPLVAGRLAGTPQPVFACSSSPPCGGRATILGLRVDNPLRLLLVVGWRLSG